MANETTERLEIQVTAKTDGAVEGIKAVSTEAQNLEGNLQKTGEQSAKTSALLERLKKLQDRAKTTASNIGGGIVRGVGMGMFAMMQRQYQTPVTPKVETKQAESGLTHIEDRLALLKSSFLNFGATATKSLATLGMKGIGIAFENTAGRVANGIKKMSRGLINVAKYRVFRFVISSITRALKEGINNLYAYSSAINGSFASALNNISTNALYLKNSLAAMVSPIITTVAPVFDWLTSKIVACTNAMAQFFSFLGGKATFTRAIKGAQTFGGAVGGATGKASKGVKKLKKDLDLLSFDEINKLSDPKEPSSSGGGGGGGGAGGGISANDMFEEADISKSVSAFAKKFKEGWKKADLTEVGTIVGTKLNNILANLNWGNVSQGIIGGFYKMGKRLATFINGFNFGFDFANLSRTIGMGVVSALEGIYGFLGNFNFERLGYQIVRFIEGIPFGKLLQSSAKILASLTVGLLNLFYGALSTAVSQAFAKVTKHFGNSIKKAGGDIIWGLFTGVLSALGNIGSWVVKNVCQPFIDAFKQALGIHSPSTVMKEIGGFVIDGLLQGLTNGAKAILKWFTDLPKKLIKLITSGAKSKTVTIKTKLAKSGWSTLEKFMKSNKVYTTKIKLGKSGWKSVKAWASLDKTYTIKTKLNKISNVAKALGLSSSIPIKIALPKIKGSVSIDTKAKTSNISWSRGTGYSYFANGGFPKTGELYMARESGSELIGSLGGRNAVANNEQIEEGIAKAVYPAVYSAIMNAMDKGALTSEVILQGDADKLFKMVRDKDKAYRMATGKSAFAR